MHLVSQSATDTQAIAATFAHRLLDQMPGRTVATVVALEGELGAGKTTFTQGLAQAWDIPQLPKSPTFLLAKEYAIPGTTYALWHLDCYRLRDHHDLEALDMHTIFANPQNIVVIEWPERISQGLPKDHLVVHLTHQDGDKRHITLPL